MTDRVHNKKKEFYRYCEILQMNNHQVKIIWNNQILLLTNKDFTLRKDSLKKIDNFLHHYKRLSELKMNYKPLPEPWIYELYQDTNFLIS